MDKGILIIGGVTILVVVGIIVASQNDKMTKLSNSFRGTDAEVISEQGVHWHPELAIYIRGQKQEIPNNIGIGSQYSNQPFYDPMM